MLEIIFYKDKNGRSDIIDYLDELQKKMETSKDARINREKILAYLVALSQYGTRIGQPMVKHIEGDIWELRPLRNRIFFFYWKENKIVLLHYYIKKSQKMSNKEFEKAKRNLKEFLERNASI
ncbi:MAG: type II toxin-antitoxin system RelE/ParE family toxin [Lachnospiraceae bacterium]|nr:type II toxin-antitoxin system RelE/ParE family toxin [Lachnospiraceae bacterium]